MEDCIKQEQMESDLGFLSGHDSTRWEVCESWMKSDANDNSFKPTNLAFPFGDESKFLAAQALNELNRTKREFVPNEKKDVNYWTKRLKNNASARRSRLKKRVIEKSMEGKLQELQSENIKLKYELAALKRHFADKLDSNQTFDDTASDMHSDLSMRTGNGSESSDSCSVTSENSKSNETDKVIAQNLPLHLNYNLTSNSSYANSNVVSNTAYAYANGWSIPFKYSFMNYAMADRQEQDKDEDGEILSKIPHKFRHKKDFHSAFSPQPYVEGNV